MRSAREQEPSQKSGSVRNFEEKIQRKRARKPFGHAPLSPSKNPEPGTHIETRGISKLRNRVIGRVFHALGLVEQWGSGIQRMTAACRDAGLAPPVLEEIGTRFRVTLRLGRIGRPALDETEDAILRFLHDGRGHLTSEVARAIRLTPRATRTRLLRLVERGLVREVGTSPQDPKRRYFLSS